MNRPVRVGIIGDFDPSYLSHAATNEALSHTARALSLTLDRAWLPTQSLAGEGSETILKQFDALCAPGGPYKSMNGVLRAIKFARERGWPFMGT